MEEAKSRIRSCIETNGNYLNLEGLGLKELPEIPPHIKDLNVDNNKLENLPDNLPITLKYLSCDYNKLKRLPNNLPLSLYDIHCSYNELIYLPENLCHLSHLHVLCCYRNYLTKLPKQLPPRLELLDCRMNKLIEFPEELPSTLGVLMSRDNPYLYVPKEITYRFLHQTNVIDTTPNYSQIFNCLKQIYLSQGRGKKLLFCEKIHDHIDEFRFRPSGGGYRELRDKNKGMFADLL